MKMEIGKICAALIFLAGISACQPAPPFENSAEANKPHNADFVAPEGYSRAFSPAPYNYRTVNAIEREPIRMGDTAERFELRDGDCDPVDCTKPRARAEIQLSQKENPARIGKDIWYGWSFYNKSVPAFTKDNSLRLVFGQWTMGGVQRPIFRFIQLGKGEGDFSKCDPEICSELSASRGDLVVQLDDMANLNQWGDAQNNGYICRLFDMTEQREKWVDLTVNTNFSTGADGYLRIWVNGNLVCDYTGPLVSPSSARAGRKPEHRHGIFSSWDKRWREAMGDVPKPTLIVYYDEFQIGKSREDVDVRMRQN